MGFGLLTSKTASGHISGVTFGKPTALREGDLLVIAVATKAGRVAFPTGFTVNNGGRGGSSWGMFVGYKVATATEPARYNVVNYEGTTRTTANTVAILAVYRNPTTALTATSIETVVTQTGFTIDSRTPEPTVDVANANAGDVLIACVASVKGGLGSFATISGYTTLVSASLTPSTPTHGAALSSLTLPDVAAGRTLDVPARGATNGWFGGVFIVVKRTASAPSAPMNLTPANGSSVNAAVGGCTFSAQFKSTDYANANGVCFRIKTGTSGSYLYLVTATGALQSSPYWNTCNVAPTADFSVTVGSVHFTDGHSYNWSFAFRESLGTEEGPFAADFVLMAATPPTVTLNSPYGTTATATPVARWTAAAGTGQTLTSFRVVVFTTAQHSVEGFTPATSASTWDSGVVAGSATTGTQPIGTALVNGASYYCYLLVAQSGGGSTWVSAPFTVQFDGPATPVLVATPTTVGYPTVELSLSSHTNLLTATEASFEQGVGSWVASTPGDWTLKQTGTWSADGSYSLGVKAKEAVVPTLTCAAKEVTAGETVTCMATVRAAGTVRTWKLQAVFEKESGAIVSTATVAAGADTAEGVGLKGHVVVPATAVKCVLQLTTTAAWAVTELHQVDKNGIFPGEVTTWSDGGFVGNVTATFERSTDTGATWSTFLGSTSVGVTAQAAAIDDVTAPHGVPVLYRARLQTPSSVTSEWATADEVTLPNAGWWLSDPTTPSSAIRLHRAQVMSTTLPGVTGGHASIQITRKVQAGFYQPFDMGTYVRVLGTVMEDEFDLGMDFLSGAEWTAFLALWLRNVETGRVLLVKSDMGGKTYWINFGPTRPQLVLRSADRTTSPKSQCTVHCYPATSLED